MPAFRARTAWCVVAVALAVRGCAWAVAAEVPGGRPVTVRVQWGGGTPHAWVGSVRVVGAPAAAAPAGPLAWRTLSTEPDAAALVHEADGTIVVHESRPCASDGVEISVAGWQHARLEVRLGPVGARQSARLIEVPLAEVLAAPFHQPLDDAGNRLTVREAPGDALRVALTAADAVGGDGADRATGPCRPGDRLRLRVEPLLVARADAQVELRFRLRQARQAGEIDAGSATLEPVTAGRAAGERRPAEFVPVEFELTLPEEEGVFELELEAVERGALRWTRPLASRAVQFAAVAEQAAARPDKAAWKTVYELDPGSPRLHERLRRLPGMPLPSLPVLPLANLPRVPTMPLPQVPLPQVTLPKVPRPDVSALVPRLGGLLATGDSVVVPHRLGPVLQLPPARSAVDPTWEALVVAGAQPGMPHAVEIEYPPDQEALVSVAVLETDPGGGTVEPRHRGGFAVRGAGLAPPAARPGLHRFVFWPVTRQPVVVLANPSPTGPALFGKVRILALATRLPAAETRVERRTFLAVAGATRATHAFLPAPDLVRDFGGPGRTVAGGGRSGADWFTHLAAMRHSADALRSQGLAGALVTVFADGAATWPSAATRRAPRWLAGADDGGLDPLPTDALSMLARIYGREGLDLVAGLSFDAPLPALEAALVDGAPPGIACVGSDGRPRRLAGGGLHYNVLDPRVQQAVAEVVGEAATRLRGASAVRGLALVMPHDGWLHLPAAAATIDDATFGRFVAATGATVPPEAAPAASDPARFAARARLVEGRLRERWLAWRAAEVAAFHARLADAIGAVDPRWSLYVVPTTLFAAGDLAPRFRPSLAAPLPGAELLVEAGLDPAATAGADRVVFVAPLVHAPGGTLHDRGAVAAANELLANASGSDAGRRGIVLVERPLEVSLAGVVPQTPFNAATPPAPCGLPVRRPADLGLAAALGAGDAEVVFDMAAAFCADEAADDPRRAWEALPAGPFDPGPVSAPLAVRTRSAAGATWVQVVNAGPAPGRAVLALAGRPAAVVDAVDGAALPLEGAEGEVRVAVPLEPWSVRALVVDGAATVSSGRLEFEPRVREAVSERLATLHRRRAALDAPAPLDVLDNPDFELGVGPDEIGALASLAGWELVEARRGTLEFVPGLPAEAGPGRALRFASVNGLSTLRSNPFMPPATGRLSVAAWLRIGPGESQPPLRMALEGVQDEREYYRFATVGGLAGGRPLTPSWAQFVLQVDDLPATALDGLRVRFDLLGPGSVQIDGVRVFDLAFDESQRVQLTRVIARLDEQFAAAALGGCVAGLDGYWPAFLTAFVPDPAAVPPPVAAGPGKPGKDPAARAGKERGRAGRWR